MKANDRTEVEIERAENLRILRISLFVTMVATATGIESDLRHLPDGFDTFILAFRLSVVVVLSGFFAFSFLRPRIMNEIHAWVVPVAILIYITYFIWLDVNSGNYLRSGYYRAILLASLIMIFFRKIPLLVQGLILAYAFFAYAVTIGIAYGLNPLGDAPEDGSYLDLLIDLMYISSIYFLATSQASRFRTQDFNLRRRLERANQIKSEIITRVNHELQIPLLGVHANLSSIRTAIQKGNDKKIPPLLKRSDSYCKYQRHLISNMLLATADEIREPFKILPDGNARVDFVFLQAYRLVRDVHAGEVRFSRPPRLHCPCQPEILMIILTNVLGNALEHSGVVNVDWNASDERVRLICSNEVMGELPDPLELIFEEGVSTRRDSTRPILGLGMAISDGLLQKIGGTIDASYDGERLYISCEIPARQSPWSLLARVS